MSKLTNFTSTKINLKMGNSSEKAVDLKILVLSELEKIVHVNVYYLIVVI